MQTGNENVRNNGEVNKEIIHSLGEKQEQKVIVDISLWEIGILVQDWTNLMHFLCKYCCNESEDNKDIDLSISRRKYFENFLGWDEVDLLINEAYREYKRRDLLDIILVDETQRYKNRISELNKRLEERKRQAEAQGLKIRDYDYKSIWETYWKKERCILKDEKPIMDPWSVSIMYRDFKRKQMRKVEISYREMEFLVNDWADVISELLENCRETFYIEELNIAYSRISYFYNFLGRDRVEDIVNERIKDNNKRILRRREEQEKRDECLYKLVKLEFELEQYENIMKPKQQNDVWL